MNHQKRSPAAVLPLAVLIGTALTAVYLTAMYLFASDLTDVEGIYTTILFQRGGASTLLILLCTVFTLLFTALPLLLFRKKKGTADAPQQKESVAMTFARCGAGICMLAACLMGFVLSNRATPYEPTAQNGNILLTAALCGIVGAFYFLLPAVTGLKKKTPLFFLGVFALLFLGCELLLTHYFMLDFLSSPTRVFAVFGYGSLMLFLLFDLKALVPERSSEGCRAAFALTAFYLNLSDGLPRLILSFAGKGGFDVSLTSFHTLLRVLMAVYALLSVLPLLLSAKKEEEALQEPVREQALPEEQSLPENSEQEPCAEPSVFKEEPAAAKQSEDPSLDPSPAQTDGEKNEENEESETAL